MSMLVWNIIRDCSEKVKYIFGIPLLFYENMSILLDIERVIGMNTKQLRCAVMLSKTRSFSEAAAKLNISQPALSKQIIHLEKDLGIKLFDRETIPVTLTRAGAFFIQEAEALVYKEDQLLRKVSQFQNEEIGQLVIGISQFRSLYMIPDMLEKLRQRYPKVQVRIHEADSKRRLVNLEEGKYDFAVVNLPVDETLFDVTALNSDTLVLAVPNIYLDKISNRPRERLSIINIADCQQLPFVTVSKSQDLGNLFEGLCEQQKVHPPVAIEVFNIATAWAMVQAGVGATILPLQLVDEAASSENITLFRIQHESYLRQPAVVTRRGQYLPEYAKYAIGLLTGAQNNG